MNTKQVLMDLFEEYDTTDFMAKLLCLLCFPQNQYYYELINLWVELSASEGSNYNKPRNNKRIGYHDFEKAIVALIEASSSEMIGIEPISVPPVSRVLFNDNYDVVNLDEISTWKLQDYIYGIFWGNSDFDDEFYKKSKIIIQLALNISDRILKKTYSGGIYDIYTDKIYIPTEDDMVSITDMLTFHKDDIESCLDDDFLYDALLSRIEHNSLIDKDITKGVFIKGYDDNLYINVSRISDSLVEAIDMLSKKYNCHRNLLYQYSQTIKGETEYYLKGYGYPSIEKSPIYTSDDGTEIYVYKAYNTGAIFIVYYVVQGEGNLYDNTNDATDEVYKIIIEFTELKKIDSNLTYLIFIPIALEDSCVCSINRSNMFKYAPLILNSNELISILINEKDTTNFIPRYIESKSSLPPNPMANIQSELCMVGIYKEHKSTFYVTDDSEMNSTLIIPSPGYSAEYIKNADEKLDKKIVDYFGNKVIVCKIKESRNIYRTRIDKRHKYLINYYVELDVKKGIWICSDDINGAVEHEILISLMDMLSYWLYECRNEIDLFFSDHHFYFVMSIEDNLNNYIYDKDLVVTTDMESILDISVEDMSKVELYWTQDAINHLCIKDNTTELETINLILSVLMKVTKDYSIDTGRIKEKFYPATKYIFDFYSSQSPICLLPLNRRYNIYVHDSDSDLCTGLANKLYIEKYKKWEGKLWGNEASKALNDMTSMLFAELKSIVSKLNYDDIRVKLFQILEEMVYKSKCDEENHNRNILCYPELKEKFMYDYSMDNQNLVAQKFLMEFVFATPPTGNQNLDTKTCEYLLSLCLSIINYAYLSDLYYYNLRNTGLEFLPSNRVSISNDKDVEVYNLNSEYIEDSFIYSGSYYSICRDESLSFDKTINQIDAGFNAEHGYSYSEFSLVIDLVIEYGMSIKDDVKTCNHDELIDKTYEIYKNNGNDDTRGTIDKSKISKIISDLIYEERPDFLTTYEGYEKWEIYPWRYNRRTSFSRKAFIKYNNNLMWGNRQLDCVPVLVAKQLYYGIYPAKSDRLNNVLSKISCTRGKLFYKFIAEQIRRLGTYEVYENRNKINNIRISDNGKDLGDIDVLIIDRTNFRVYICEVKSFNISRNAYEIAMEYKAIFDDSKNKKCYLSKHLNRVNWCIGNHDALKNEFKLSSGRWYFLGCFIINEPVLSKEFIDTSKGIEFITKFDMSVESFKKMKPINEVRL